MKLFYDSVTNKDTLRPLVGATIIIKDNATNLTVTIYSANDPIAGNEVDPLLTDDTGYFEFFVPDGKYNIEIWNLGNLLKTISEITLDDPIDPSLINQDGGLIENATLRGGVIESSVLIQGDLSTATVDTETGDDEAISSAFDKRLVAKDIVNDWVLTGMEPATSGTLTSDISAGTAYVNGVKLSTIITANTYGAGDDTYVDIDETGTFIFNAVSNGSGAPAIAVGTIRLAKVVTDGSAITSVVDMRTLIPLLYNAYLVFNNTVSGFTSTTTQDAIDEVKALVDTVNAALGIRIDENKSKVSTVRNAAMNQDPVSQGESSRSGMSSAIYTGDGLNGRTVDNGLDMATGDFGGLVWIKNRDLSVSHLLTDTVRGIQNGIFSDTTGIEINSASYLQSFNSNGFTVGTVSEVNTNTIDYVAWSLQTTKKKTGVTNRNKAYTAHYNPDMGFQIDNVIGDELYGHEVPNFIGPLAGRDWIRISKNRDIIEQWSVGGSLIGDSSAGDYLLLNGTGAIVNSVATKLIGTDNSFQLGTSPRINGDGENVISYTFASVEGVSKVGKYIGTGAAGNYVDCGFKAGFVLVKNLSNAADWQIVDISIRGEDLILFPNISNAEAIQATRAIGQSEDGFYLKSTGATVNTDGDEYLFLAFAETSTDATKTKADYNYPTTADVLSIVQDTHLGFANGFDALGQVDTNEVVPASTTVTLGAGFESKHLWLYKDKAGSYATTENRPLEGITRNDADKYGIQSPLDATLRTNSPHSDYESDTGIALASSETAGFEAWESFLGTGSIADIERWASLAAVSWLQYKHTEKRILKSWRIQACSQVNQLPTHFTIEGSNDGLNWTAIDSTYTAGTYAGNGVLLWGDLETTAGNTTAYLYHRLNITAVVSGTVASIQELEFNTILSSDYYLVEEGKMFNSAGSGIERVYLAELMTDSDGDVIWFKNLPVGKAKIANLEVFGSLLYKGSEIIDSDKNLTGSYIKYADGTLICWHIGDELKTTDFAAGAVFLDSGTVQDFEYPVDFIEDPTLTPLTKAVSGHTWGTRGTTIASSVSNTGTISIFSFLGTATAYAGYIAIGRWKA